jgi:hypothetical protein
MQARSYLARVARTVRADGHDPRPVIRAVRPYLREADAFDVGSALYWAGANAHSGQWSLGYALLCASEYSPGACERDTEPDSLAAMMREELEACGAL